MSFDDDFAAFEAALAGTGPVKPAVAATFSAPAVPSPPPGFVGVTPMVTPSPTIVPAPHVPAQAPYIPGVTPVMPMPTVGPQQFIPKKPSMYHSSLVPNNPRTAMEAIANKEKDKDHAKKMRKAKAGKEVHKDPQFLRTAGQDAWYDPTLGEFPEGDDRLFIGDLAPETTEHMLRDAFRHYPSVSYTKVVRDPRTRGCRGYGFVCFHDRREYIEAFKNMNGKYCGTRPMKIRKSNFSDRQFHGADRKTVKKRMKVRSTKFG
eukprot:TRINITY_DN3145_c0_g1_i2.p1 TRINITY_DN3145_c0_g1~~TRINITY_DN3145_c0_g1_i2.p1  ORF type:complete len:261 (-),score=45.26 TRINITY_DN3145_c0_g1_i2:50-832(-)